MADNKITSVCFLCHGTGYVRKVWRPLPTPNSNPIDTVVGSKVISVRCPVCHGKGTEQPTNKPPIAP